MKIRAPAHKLVDVEYKMKVSNLLLYKEYDDRIVNSIYLDDVYLSSMNEYIQGIANRSKWRFRWYNNNIEKASLERKQKFGYVGNKQNFEIRLQKNTQNFSEVKNTMQEQLSKNILIQINKLEPKVKVVYKRSYWRSTLCDIRMTIDSDVKYYRTNTFRSFGAEIPLNTDSEILLELKYPDKYEDSVAEVFSEFNLITSRNSKYTRAISRSL